MSHKTSPARRAAFFSALRETGNQTLACERAKVSRSWVCLHRRTDPGFDAEVRVAIAGARASLANAPGQARSTRKCNRPPRGWGHLDGEELVVKGTGGSALRPAQAGPAGRRVQVARARLKQWTPRVEQSFLAALMATCNVKAACAEVGMSAAGAYAHRKRWPCFAELWDEAVREGYARIEVALLQNGLNLFSESELPPETELRGMDVAQAIRLLHMHKYGVTGLGKAPGVRWRPPPTLAALKPGILRNLAIWQAGKAIPAAVLAADRRAYRSRRPSRSGKVEMIESAIGARRRTTSVKRRNRPGENRLSIS